MRTPAGKECRYYYQDFHRGRDLQECRLEKENPDSEKWRPHDCDKCPVPDILRANADPDMQLKLTITRGFLGFGRKLNIEATSRRDGKKIEDPYVGRVEDNPGLDIFRQAMDDIDHD